MRSWRIKMHVLEKEGGIRVFGKEALAWKNPPTRTVGGVLVEFSSEVDYPAVLHKDANNKIEKFIFPKFVDQHDYEVHLLETGTVIVIKDGWIFLCFVLKEKPQVALFQSSTSGSFLTLMSTNPTFA